MPQPLSEQLATLSTRVKKAEDGIATAKAEAHDRLEARRDEARAKVEASIKKADSEIRTFGDQTKGDWDKLQAKVSADMAAFKAKVDQLRQDRAAGRAEHHAERMEAEAAFAIDYAIASIDQAELAVIDAFIARIDAKQAKS
jgi:outer membrane murein-binding lipoprotein Lpp